MGIKKEKKVKIGGPGIEKESIVADAVRGFKILTGIKKPNWKKDKDDK